MLELNREKIEDFIPHREPMLLLESITIHDSSIVTASYFFNGDEWFFKGHYPGNPIVPGVILCEIMAQASCGLFINKGKGTIPYLISIDRAKFRKIVHPQDTVCIKSTFLYKKGLFYFTQCTATINKVVCAECILSFYLAT